MGSDPQSYLEEQYTPIRALRDALQNRAKAAHDYILTYSVFRQDLRPTHEEPYASCPSPGCEMTRIALRLSEPRLEEA